MNLLPSLVLYNPLEAMVIILLLCYASKSKMSIGSLILNSYIFGTLNLISQFMCELLFGTVYYSFILSVVQYIFSPLITYAYANKVMRINIGIAKTFVLKWLFTISVCFIVLSLGKLNLLNVFDKHFEFIQEFIINISVRIPQFIAIGLLYLRKRLVLHERISEEDCGKES